MTKTESEDERIHRAEETSLYVQVHRRVCYITHEFIYLWYAHTHMIPLTVMSQQSFRHKTARPFTLGCDAFGDSISSLGLEFFNDNLR